MNAAVGAEGPLALVSVSDKAGIVEFCRALAEMGFRLLSTGGTARALTAAGLPVTEVSDHTDSPEIMGGRVKTLHPRVHGGLLGQFQGTLHPEQIQRFSFGIFAHACVVLKP